MTTLTDEAGRSISAQPLHWPLQYKRTLGRQPGPFKTTLGAARDGLLRELDLLGASQVIVSSNLPLKKDGTFYAKPVALADPGVAVYFRYLGAQRVLASDKWDQVADNVQALRKTVEALRGLDRWGCSDIMAGTFTGLRALAPAAADSPDADEAWWVVLQVPPTANEAEIRAAARQRLADLKQRTLGLPLVHLTAGQDRIILARGKALGQLPKPAASLAD